MKTIALKPSLLISLGFSLVLFGCASAPKMPDVSEEGLARVKDSEADAVYLLPAANLSIYTKVALLEPQIAFRAGWQSDTGIDRPMRRISDSDMQKMIETGRELLKEEFTKELKKGGYTLVTEAGPDVLTVKVAIVDLDVFAPDPNNMANVWVKTYTEGAGEAKLIVELRDSVSGQLLVRAFDHKYDMGGGYSWRIARTQNTNINDARAALGSWAEMLAKGLNRAKAAKK